MSATSNQPTRAERSTASLRPLFAPRSIALVGASGDPNKFGGRPVGSLRRHGFAGDLHVVNPARREVQGTPCLASVADLPDDIDLAVVLLGAEDAVDAVATCAERGVGALAVLAGGFRETGSEGAAREREVVRIARERGIRLLGPNCPGFVNLDARVACSASAYALREDMYAGPHAFVVQSGAVAGVVCDRAFDAGIGVSYAICTGNEADVTVADVVRFLAAETDTRSVGLYLESISSDLVDALRTARGAGLGLTVLKVGRSERGRAVASSHTGALVGSDEAFDALCASFGIVRAQDYSELLEATTFASRPPWSGGGIAIVGASGGMNAVLTDAAAEAGLSVPSLADSTLAGLAELTPDFGSVGNPVDVSSSVLLDPGRLGAAVSVLAGDPAIDGVVVIVGDHPPELSKHLARGISDATSLVEKPVVVQWSAGSLSDPGIFDLGRAGVPVSHEPSRCARILGTLVRSARARHEPGERAARVPEPRAWSEGEAKALLSEYGVASAPAPGPGDRAVVKADCVGEAHKTEMGAVRIGIAPEAVETASAEVVAAARSVLGEARVRGALVERLVEPVAEFVLSVHRDPQLGAIVTLGSGGILVEVAGDAASRLAPVEVETAEAMISELRGTQMLDGIRGRPRGDRAALAHAVVALSQLGASWGDALGTIEINPLAVLEDGVVALDAVITPAVETA